LAYLNVWKQMYLDVCRQEIKIQRHLIQCLHKDDCNCPQIFSLSCPQMVAFKCLNTDVSLQFVAGINVYKFLQTDVGIQVSADRCRYTSYCRKM
jgi:hypothetical protein